MKKNTGESVPSQSNPAESDPGVLIPSLHSSYQALFEFLPGAAVIINSDWAILAINAEGCGLLGIHPAEPGITSFLSVLTFPSRKADLLLLSQGAQLKLEGQLERPDGSPAWLECLFKRLPDDNYVVLLRDITAHYQHEVTNSILLEDHTRQAQELALLNLVRSRLAEQLETGALFRTVVEEICKVFKDTQVSACLLEGDQIVLQHSAGFEVFVRVTSINQGVIGRVIRNNKAELVVDVATDPDFLGDRTSVKSEVCVPLRDDGKVIGALNLESKAGKVLVPDDLQLMCAIAEFLNLALHRTRLYAALREREERLQEFVSNVPLVLFNLNPDGVFTFFEGKTLSTFGFVPGQLVGKNITDVFEEFPAILADFKRALAGETFSSVLVGTDYVVEIWYAPLLDHTGKVYAVNGMCQDIRARYRAEEELTIRARQRQALAEFGRIALSEPDLTAIFENAAQLIAQTLEFEYCVIAHLAPGEPQYCPGLYCAASVGWLKSELNKKIPQAFSQQSPGLTIQAYLDHAVLLVPDWSQTTYQPDAWQTDPAIISSGSVPIALPGKAPVGVVTVYSRIPRKVTRSDLSFVEGVAQLLAVTIDRKEAEKALQAERDYALQITNNLGQGLAVLDATFHYQYVNPELARLLEYTQEELIGLTPEQLVPPEEQGVLEEAIALRRQGKGNYYETTLLSKTGRRIFVGVTGMPVWRDNRLVRDIAVFTDLSRHKQIEDDMRTALAKERELHELKSRFISMTSHEFRTPLSTILTNSELLEHYSDRFSDGKKHELLKRIQHGVKYMTQLLEDILLLGKMDAAKTAFNPAPLQLEALCFELAYSLPLAFEGNRQVMVEAAAAPGVTYLDENLVRHILTNVLNNALKYSSPDQPVYLSIKYSPVAVTIIVQDQGIGIPADDQPYLFEVFHRGTNVGTTSGTGLGLNIVKRCVELHRGTIKITSQVGEGTRVAVTLPHTRPGSAATGLI